MNFFSLFAGIGGFDLGLELAGMTCVGQCEIDPFCQAVLAKRWPHVWRHDDVRTIIPALIGRPCGRIDLISAGVPCQPTSDNGKKLVEKDARWLWPETIRTICHIGPRWAILETPTGTLRRGFGQILGMLAESGYDAEWDCIPAAFVGAEHLRDRAWIIAYPAGEGPQGEEPASRIWGRRVLTQCPRWSATPRLRGNPNGVPRWMDRLHALGNSIVPQIPEMIGRWIIQFEELRSFSAYNPRC